jgi:hypothetical protein
MEYMESKMQDQIEGAISTNDELRLENEQMLDLLRWAYSKLHTYSYRNMDDALKLDEIKLLLTVEHGAC